MEPTCYIQLLKIHVFLPFNLVLFSHWDVDKNYEEGGFNFRNGDTITVVFNN